MQYDYVVVGGGFFGCRIATELRKRYPKRSVVLIEREGKLMRRASFNNQARIHQGYHYPRSIFTALRSRVNFARFVRDFSDCVYTSFDQYYGIGQIQSKVTASQFETFCERIGAPIAPAPLHIKALFNRGYVEDVFKVTEYAFDADKLAGIMHGRLSKARVNVTYNTEVQSVAEQGDGGLSLKLGKTNGRGQTGHLEAKRGVFMCLYSNTNRLLAASGAALIPLKQEMTEMVLVDTVPALQDVGITLMDGPFFSLMPFPPYRTQVLSHVRYTPHTYWFDHETGGDNQKQYERAPRKSNFLKMIKDTSRYLPAAAGFKYKGSIWEVKTVLPRSEQDDGRPILFKNDAGGINNLTCVIGGKIDNIYDLSDHLQGLG